MPTPGNPTASSSSTQSSNSDVPVILITAGYDRSIRFWEALSGSNYRTVSHADSQINCLCITPDGQYVAAAGTSKVRLYEINSNNPNPVTNFDGHTGNVTAVGFQREGRWMYTGGEDGTVKVWGLGGVPSCQLEFEHKCSVSVVLLHPLQGELISGDHKGNIKVLALREDRCTQTVNDCPDDAILSMTLTADGNVLIAGNSKGVILIYDVQFLPPTTEKPVDENGAKGALDQQTEMRIQLRRTFKAHDGYVLKCRLAPNNRALATTSSDTTIKLWEFNGNDVGNVKHTLHGHTKWVWDIAFSTDSAYIVSACSDHTARLWDLRQAEAIRTYSGHQKAVSALALNDYVVFDQ